MRVLLRPGIHLLQDSFSCVGFPRQDENISHHAPVLMFEYVTVIQEFAGDRRLKEGRYDFYFEVRIRTLPMTTYSQIADGMREYSQK
jgi:hypothetical protein